MKVVVYARSSTPHSQAPAPAPDPLLHNSLAQAMRTGAVLGLLAWMVYGALEAIFAYAIPVFENPEIQVASWQWRYLGLFMLLYAIAGVVSGAAGGALLAWAGRANRRRLEIAAILPLVAAFGVNLLFAPSLGRSEVLTLALTAAVWIALTAAIFSDAWRGRTRWLANPWVTTLLLFAMPWVTLEAMRYSSTLSKSFFSLLAIAAVCCIAFLLERVRPASIARRLVEAAVVLIVLVAAGLMHALGRPAFQAPPVRAAAGEPNIILISLDTVRADHLPLYGYARDTSPALRAFADHATLFSRAIAASDVTLSSHGSIFTGLYPSWHGAYPVMPDFAYGRPLGASVTLSKILSEHGYATAGIVANHSFLQPSMGLSQGFQVWDHPVPQRLSSSRLPFYLREAARSILSRFMDTAGIDALSMRAADINTRAEEILASAKPDVPFFLFLNYMDAHAPYVPPAPFRNLFPGRDPHFRPAAQESLSFDINLHGRHVTAGQERDLISQYDGGIAYLDSQLARLFDRLRGAGQFDNALIIVVSDHGESFGERDLMQHAQGFVYQDDVHVPLIVKYPGQRDPRRYTALASHVDLMPTILAAAHLPTPANLPGRDLALPEDPDRVVYAEGRLLSDDLTFRLRGVRRAIFHGSSKLIVWTLGPSEFYDLAADPGETRNAWVAHRVEAAALNEQMERWMAAMPHVLPQVERLNHTSIDRIRSLGYAQ